LESPIAHYFSLFLLTPFREKSVNNHFLYLM
jgi:hypothetical protein